MSVEVTVKPVRTGRYPGPRPQLKPRRLSVGSPLADFREGPLVVIVWVLAAVVAGFLLARRAQRFEVLAVARPLQYQVSAQASGSVATVMVDIYDAVEPGQVLIRLDGAPVEARIATARGELDRLLAEVKAGASGLTMQQAGMASDRRRFQTDEERLWLDVLSLKVDIESDGIDLARLNQEVKRAEALVRQGIRPRSELEDLELSRDEVARRIEENKALRAQTEEEYRRATARRESFETQFPASTNRSSVLEPLRAAIRVQEQRIAEIEVERSALEIRAPVAGQITQILARGGQWVQPGEALASVTEKVASEILAYIPESFPEAVAPETSLLVSRINDPKRVAEFTVSRVGPAIEALPQRLWHFPTVPEYGRPVVITGVAALNLTPGELVAVRPRK